MHGARLWARSPRRRFSCVGWRLAFRERRFGARERRFVKTGAGVPNLGRKLRFNHIQIGTTLVQTRPGRTVHGQVVDNRMTKGTRDGRHFGGPNGVQDRPLCALGCDSRAVRCDSRRKFGPNVDRNRLPRFAISLHLSLNHHTRTHEHGKYGFRLGRCWFESEWCAESEIRFRKACPGAQWAGSCGCACGSRGRGSEGGNGSLKIQRSEK